MDLIGTVTSSLGIDPRSAEGAVGSVLKLLKQNAPADAFGEVEAKVPEASQWMQKAASPEGGGGGGLGDLLGSAAGALGGALGGSLGQAAGPLGGLVASLSKAGVGGDALGKLLPLVMQFLQSRVGAGVVEKLVAAVPALAPFLGGAGGTNPSLGGMLGSLFK